MSFQILVENSSGSIFGIGPFPEDQDSGPDFTIVNIDDDDKYEDACQDTSNYNLATGELRAGSS